MASVLKRRGRVGTHRGGGHGRTQAVIRVMPPQARVLKPPDTARGEEGFAPRDFRGRGPC